MHSERIVSSQARSASVLDGIGNTPLVEIDDFVAIHSDESIAEMRRIACQHGCFVGPSPGGHLLAARRLRERHPELRNVVTLFCDEGEKYLSEHFRQPDVSA